MNQSDANELLRKLYSRLQDLKAENETLKKGAHGEPIAIIGIGCRFAGGVDSVSALARTLRETPDQVTESPSARPFFGTTARPNWTSSVIDEVDQFDAEFFGLTAQEAAEIDPQQRLLLEVAYQAVEDARYPAASLKGRDVGVFVGMSTDDYQLHTIAAASEGAINAYSTLGTARSLSAGRIAYFFDFNGPVLQVDTACSSSLMSVHLACQSLRLNECSMAIAGGVNLMLSPETYATREAIGALSPTGKCHTFSNRADGYARGEGCGLVVLKKLSAALADKDRIQAVIYADTVNHDGRSNGLTAPNGDAQRRLMLASLNKAGLDINALDYVETHGTGTRLGDPIEVHSIGETLAKHRASPLWVGSLKTQLGHLEAAAGVASLIKVVAQLSDQRLLPGPAIDELNPLINWSKYNIRVLEEQRAWPRVPGKRRFAAVNAFGLSGTNVNVILGDAPSEGGAADAAEGPLAASMPLLCVSGKTRIAYLKNLHAMQNAVSARDTLDELMLSSCVHRDHFTYRSAFVCRGKAALQKDLELAKHALLTPAVFGRLAFVFSGRESGAGQLFPSLYRSWPLFQRQIDEGCGDAVVSLTAEGALRTDAPEAVLAVLTGYGLARTYAKLGLAPQILACAGEGVLAAAVFAQALSLKQSLALVAPNLVEDGTQVLAELGREGSIARPRVPLMLAHGNEFLQADALTLPMIQDCLDQSHHLPMLPDAAADHLLWLCSNDRAGTAVLLDQRAIFAVHDVEDGGDSDSTEFFPYIQALRTLYNLGAALDFLALKDVPRSATRRLAPGYQFDRHPLWTRAATLVRKEPESVQRYQVTWQHLAPVKPGDFGNLLVLENGHLPDVVEAFLARMAGRMVRLPMPAAASLAACAADFKEAFDVLDLRFFTESPRAAFDYHSCLRQLDACVQTVQALAPIKQARYHLVLPADGDGLPALELAGAPVAGFLRSASHEHPELVRSLAHCAVEYLPMLLSVLPTLKDYEQIRVSRGALQVPRVLACDDELLPADTANRLTSQPAAAWITGGLGGLGLELATRLARNGTRHLLLTGRRAELTLAGTIALSQIRALGAQVTVEALDVTDAEAVTALVARFGADLPQISSLIHAAGISEFCSVDDLSFERLEQVCAAKIAGAWNLHRASMRLGLRDFVLYSSISSVWGSAGLSHYAAANAFLDALAQQRWREGLPAVVINWGPWAKVGMAARDTQKDMLAWGLIPLEADSLDPVLQAMFERKQWAQIVCNLDRERFRLAFEARHAVPLLVPIFMQTGQASMATMPADGARKPFTDLLGKERVRCIADVVADRVATVLNRPSGRSLSRHQPLHEMGIDSLMAIDVANVLSAFFHHRLPSTLIFDYPSIDAIAAFIDASAYPAPAEEEEGLSAEEEALLLVALQNLPDQ